MLKYITVNRHNRKDYTEENRSSLKNFLFIKKWDTNFPNLSWLSNVSVFLNKTRVFSQNKV